MNCSEMIEKILVGINCKKYNLIIIIGVLLFYSCENTIIDSSIASPSYGCTDESACNYDNGSDADDGSCEYYDVCEVCDGDGSTCINNGVIINEINYNSSDDFDPEDWVELYNSSDSPINIGNWELRDNEYIHVFEIPENTILSAGDFIVLCRDKSAFTSQFPDLTNFIGDLGFLFSSEGDQVRLFDHNGLLVDKVEYDDEDPWPTAPDGSWPTLELIHPSLDNALAESWTASKGNGGTPGELNNVDDE